MFFRNLEKYEEIAKYAARGALADKCKGNKSSMKRCRWWNRGYCREGTDRCPYYNPADDCEQHLQEGHCLSQGCNLQHRRRCKYWGTVEGCFRKDDCQYLHIDNLDTKTAAKVGCISQDKPLYINENIIVNTVEDLVTVKS